MTKPKLLMLVIPLISYSPASLSEVSPARDEVLQVVEEMNAAWADQDLERCLSYFSVDTDFENSFGWLIQGREAMGRFLEWLFAKYPKQESTNIRVLSAVEFLAPDLALVETARRIAPPNAESPARVSRATYHVRQDNGTWLISKTRIWEPRLGAAAPEDLVAPSRFPEILSEHDSEVASR